MATAPRTAFFAVKPLVGLSIATESFPETASVTFKAGACVVLASGFLSECGTDPVLIAGIASRDGQNGATAGLYSQDVQLAHPSTLFCGNVDNGSGTATTAASDRGKNYGIAKDSTTGKWYIDKSDQTNKRVVVWSFWDGIFDGVAAAIGDTLGWCYFQFDNAYFQLSKTS